MPVTATYTRGSCLNLILGYLFVPIFLHRVINSWNSLSDEIIFSNTVGQFKAKLDKDWELGHGFEHRLSA